MSTTGVFRCLGLAVYPKVDQGQLTEVVAVTDQKNVRFTSGYVGDKTTQLPSDECSAIIDLPEVVVRCWANRDKTALDAVDIRSKHSAPFRVDVSLRNIPPVNETVNQKYLDIFSREGVKGAYDALKANPADFPMVPLAAFNASGLNCRIPSAHGLVNFRQEIFYRVEMPYGCGEL
jgi:hypothetical protein